MPKLKITSAFILLTLNSCTISVPKNPLINDCEYNPKMSAETNKQIETLNDLMKQLIIGSEIECSF
jgi:hypothetical protein